jgi:peptidoglycan hydrolase-like protein with peptidoglycan-binding domain
MAHETTTVEVTVSVPLLRKGAQGPPVARIQDALNHVAGHDRLQVDGIFGPRTEAAVRDFQQNEHLSVDGIVGRQTWTALLKRYLVEAPPD